MEVAKIRRPPHEIIEGFKQIPTSTISDVLDRMAIDGIINGFQHLVVGIRIVGPAQTVKEAIGVRGTYARDQFPTHQIIDMMEKGDVLVCDNGGKQVSTMGDLGSKAMKLRGVAGMVVDGGVRDVEGIIEVGFPAYARYTCATSGMTRVKVVGLNVPVQIDNIKVNPGDIIVADDTAVAVVPADKAEEILRQCRQIGGTEKRVIKELEAGKSFEEALKIARTAS